MDGGKPDEGFVRDQVGVEFYCKSYLAGFVVIPTPEEQQATYLENLKGEGLAGKFTSDSEAVGHAKKVCGDLDSGGKHQGQPQDLVGVKVYCATYADSFRVLRTISVKGTFTLLSSDYNEYYPSILSVGGSCMGDNGYSDITPGTAVIVKNDAGTVLARTVLGTGVGNSASCSMPFTVELTEGEDSYLFSVSHRGDVSETFAQLNSSGVALSLGS